MSTPNAATEQSTTTPAAPPKPAPPAAKGSESNGTEGALTLPDDHPLVKALAAQKDEIRSLKERTRRLDEIEESQKSEAERAADALAKVKADADTARAELLRYRTAAENGITSTEDIELFLTGRDEATLQRQAKALAERNSAAAGPRAPKPNPAQREGDAPADDKDATARAFFGI